MTITDPAFSPATISRRTALKSFGALALAAGLASCSGFSSSSSSSTLQMMFWGQGSATTKTLDAIKLFQKKSKVNVDTQYTALNQYYDKLATRIAGGHAPDVFQIHLPYLSDYVKRGVALNLDDHIAELALESVPASIVQTCKLQGHYYYVPLGLATQPATVYSKTVLDELGLEAPKNTWTLNDFRAMTEQVVKASKGKYYGSSDAGGTYIELDAFLRGYGKGLFTADGKLGFDQDQFAAWLKFLTTDPQAATTLGLTRGVPISQNLRTRVSSHLNAVDKAIVDNLELIESQDPAPLLPQPPGAGPLLSTSLQNANQAVGFGKSTIDQAVAQFFADARQTLK